MMIFVKALAFAIFLGLIGLVIGPILGLLLMPAPAESCGMWWIIPIGTGAAYLYSLVAVTMPGIFPPGFRGEDGTVGLYFEAAAVIIALILLGQVLELRARDRTSGALRALLDLAPPIAHRLSADGAESDVALEQIHPGERLRVRPGESVPLDGVVLEGRSAVDEDLRAGDRDAHDRPPAA